MSLPLLLTLSAFAAPGSIPAEDIRSVVVRGQRASVVLLGDADPGLIRPTARDEATCPPLLQQQGDSVLIDLGDCDLTWELPLPSGAAVQIELGQGVIQARSMTQPLRVELKSGELRLDQHQADLRADVGSGSVSGGLSGPTYAIQVQSGSIHLDGLIGAGQVSTRLGNVGLTFGALPPGEVQASVGTGSLTVLVPEGAPVAWTAEVGLGKPKVEIPHTPDAPSRLQLNARAGQLLLTTLESELGQKRAHVPR